MGVTQVGDVLRALGQNPTEGDVKKLVQSTNSKGGPDARVTFETFLPLLQAVSGKKITDTVDDFVEGLRHFDKEGNGRISAIELRHLLTSLGEKMSEEEVEQLIHGKEDSQGNINYEEFCQDGARPIEIYGGEGGGGGRGSSLCPGSDPSRILAYCLVSYSDRLFTPSCHVLLFI